MKEKITIGIIILILLLIVISTIFTLPNFKELNINSAIEKANYCEIDSDCVDAGGKCPFGCYVYVNKNEVDKISKLIQSYDSKCIYDCALDTKVVCENSKCKEVFE